jgi:dTDP-glucose 4,6-dehydratase
MAIDDGRAIPTVHHAGTARRAGDRVRDREQTRSICYVDDLVRGILALLDSHETGPVNCGTQHEISMDALANEIIRLTGSSSPVVHLPKMPDDPERRRPDLTLAGELLGYAPTVGPEEGLRRTIAYFADRLGTQS